MIILKIELFLFGVVIGTFLGAAIMCLLQVSRSEED